MQLPKSFDVLDSLVSKSLIRQTESDGAPRLTILETIREFGLDYCRARVNWNPRDSIKI
jgi:hypothetical protein